jgi:hypothetical protein
MKRILAALPLLAAAAAHAGSSGAGPAASAGPGIGAIVMPGSHAVLGTPAKDDYTDRIVPGNGAMVKLAGEQLQRAATALRGFNGAMEEGSIIRAPTVLSDGTAAVIALDTRTGRLSITRQE